MQRPSRNLLEVNLWIAHYGRWLTGINTPTPLELIATAPSTKQIAVLSAHSAATGESLNVLITPSLAPRYPDGRS
jgi:hypothetical protein